MEAHLDDQTILAIQRPSPTLWKYYMIMSFAWGPLFPIPLMMYYLRYRTLQYRFDHVGVTMRTGHWSRRGVSVGYTRIQDIHIRSNIVERWLQLARIEVQTASSNAGAELIIEGVCEYTAVRNFLYARMQDGTQTAYESQRPTAAPSPATLSATSDSTRGQALTAVLQDVVVELRALRTFVEQQANTKEGSR